MVPVGAMLIGALLIIASLFSASFLTSALWVLMSIAGVATMIVGMAMLFGIAHGRE
jgi:uncharacterized protein (DUF983 family)